MTNPTTRRPLPALVFLLALTLLTSLVWWRVLHRGDAHSPDNGACSPSGAQLLPRPETVAVTVLNSTNRTGLAKSAATALSRAGFTVAKFANDVGHPTIRGVAHIRYTPDQRDAATLLSYYLPGAVLVARDGTQSTVVVSLGRKYDKVATRAQVRQAMAKDDVALVPRGTATVPDC